MFKASTYNKRIKNKEPITIIEVEYYNPDTYHSTAQHLIDSGHYDPKWKITIYALPSEYIALAKDQMKNKVLLEVSSLINGNITLKSRWRRYYDLNSKSIIEG